MARSLVRSPLVACLLVSAVSVSSVDAQTGFVDVAFDQSFSSTAPLRSPGGFAASTGILAVWGPLGLHATYRQITDGGDDIVQDCGGAPASCVPGTLAVSYRMRSAGLGISYDFINPTDVMLTLGLTVTRNWRTERVEHLSTGSRSTNELPVSFGGSASADLRLRPLLSGFRPEFSVRYDYSGSGECDAPTSCWRGRNAFGFSVGFSWVFRPPRQD